MDELTRAEMAEDLSCLVQYLTTAHPDPYRGWGGPVAFYRAVADIEVRLPAQASRPAFLQLLRPLVAGLRDGHTTIGPRLVAEPIADRLWMDWGIVENTLYVAAVYADAHVRLLGSRLRAVAGRPLDMLVDRLQQLVGCDNPTDALRRLVRAFQDRELLAEVVGREPASSIAITVERPDGRLETVPVIWSDTVPGPAVEPASSVRLPPLGPSQLGWGFLDDAKAVACLRIGPLMRYREAGEGWRHTGFRRALSEWYQEVYGIEPPDPTALDAFLATRPAASEVFRDLMEAMRAAGTRRVIVDVSACPGGNSALAAILGWFLFGEEALLAIDEGYQIPRYSDLYVANYSRVPEPAALAHGGYDFRDEQAWRDRRTPSVSAARREWQDWTATMPSFHRAVSDAPNGSWTRPEVAVVTSANTYSAGFDVALTLRKLGAVHVGVPSAQSPNCFIDALRYTLPHSGLSGTISFKESRALPNAVLPDGVLPPQVPLTYAQLRAFGFDPAAGVRLAMTATAADPVLDASDSP